MGSVASLFKHVWNDDETSLDQIEDLVRWVQGLMGNYALPIILCCTGSTAIVLWQVGWYTALYTYLIATALCLGLIMVLFWYVKAGVEDMRKGQRLALRLIQQLREAADKKRSAARGPTAAEQLGKAL